MWAKSLGRPFRHPEVMAEMRRIHPQITNGSFYHLIRRGEIKKVRRGLFVHPDYYDQAILNADSAIGDDLGNLN